MSPELRLCYSAGVDLDGQKRIGRMVRRGQSLKALYGRLPCRFTFWLLRRQVSRIERAMGPKDMLGDTWGMLYRKARSPLQLVHEAKVRQEAESEEFKRARAALKKLFADHLADVNARQGSASGPSRRLPRQRQRERPTAAD